MRYQQCRRLQRFLLDGSRQHLNDRHAYNGATRAIRELKRPVSCLVSAVILPTNELPCKERCGLFNSKRAETNNKWVQKSVYVR